MMISFINVKKKKIAKPTGAVLKKIVPYTW